jgi:hypothetical protein
MVWRTASAARQADVTLLSDDTNVCLQTSGVKRIASRCSVAEDRRQHEGQVGAVEPAVHPSTRGKL